MAVKSRRSYKGAPISNTLSASINQTDTTINLSNAMNSSWPTGSEPFFCVIEPGTTNEEKVCVVYASSTSVTVVDPTVTSNWTSTGTATAGRGVDNTTARSHAASSVIYPVFTSIEADNANELVSKYAHQGAIVHQGSSTFTELQIGTAAQVLRVNSGATAPEWGQVATAGITDGAVTLAKLASAIQAALNPPGAIQAYGGGSAPTGYLLCDGSAVSRSTYADLFTAISTTYGSGDGSTTFNVPNLKGRVPVGKDASQTEFDVLGETGGTKSTTLTTTELPAHTHSIDHDHPSATTSASDLSHTHTFSGTVAGDGAHSHTITITDPGHGHNFDYSGSQKGTGASISVVGPTGSAAQFPVNNATTGITASSASATHSHTYSGTTSAASATMNHSHTFDVPAFTGTSGSSGSGAAFSNLPPYIVVNYIIKT